MTRTLAAVLQAVLLIFAALGASAATAELVNENILIVAPPGYKVGFHDKKPETQMTEFVPANQTVENWTEMVTVQVFFGLKATPEEFMRELEKRWRAACPGAEDGAPVASGPENGYPTLVSILNCPQIPAPENRKSPGSRRCRAMTASTWCRRRSSSRRQKSRSSAGSAISRRSASATRASRTAPARKARTDFPLRGDVNNRTRTALGTAHRLAPCELPRKSAIISDCID